MAMKFCNQLNHVNLSSSSNPFFVGPSLNHVQEAHDHYNVVELFNFQFDSLSNPPYKK